MKLYRWHLMFALLLLGTTLGWAQQAAPVKTVVIHAGHMLDVKTGKSLSNQTIVIQGDKISGVGASQVPAGATVIELSNATVLPGLIDAHTHITLTPNFGYSRLAISVPREALTGARNSKITLEAGFTTIRNVGASGYASGAYAVCQRWRCARAHGGQLGLLTSIHRRARYDNNLLPFDYPRPMAGSGRCRGCPHKTRESSVWRRQSKSALLAAYCTWNNPQHSQLHSKWRSSRWRQLDHKVATCAWAEAFSGRQWRVIHLSVGRISMTTIAEMGAGLISSPLYLMDWFSRCRQIKTPQVDRQGRNDTGSLEECCRHLPPGESRFQDGCCRVSHGLNA
jgi:hypothetical protein